MEAHGSNATQNLHNLQEFRTKLVQKENHQCSKWTHVFDKQFVHAHTVRLIGTSSFMESVRTILLGCGIIENFT